MLADLFSAPFRAPAECDIKVRGRPISALYPYLSEVRVELGRERAGVATLVFETRRDEKGRWSVQDAEVLAPWEPIVIEAVFGPQRKEEILRGYIRQVRADYPEDVGAARVTVACQDESLAMDREHVRRVWGADVPTTDRVILMEIAGRYGLTVDLTSGGGMSGLVVPQDSTDIRFLRARAEANGYELLVQGGELYFGPMRLTAEPQPTLRVYAGLDTHCRALSITTDGHLPNAVAVDLTPEEGSSPSRREVMPDLPLLGTQQAHGGREGRDFTWLLTREGSVDEEELVARAQRKVNDFSLRVRAEGEVDGTAYGHVLQVGQPVSVDGVGEWLGGVFYVDAVTHLFSQEGYRQGIRLLRNAYGDNLGGGALNALKGIL
ncbi:phage late control D family protein [Pyxidicoccus sp. 3LG]